MQSFIIIHLVAALLALFLGAIVLFRRKGTTSHRLLGRVWVMLMITICLSSFFIQTIYPFGWFNFIHLLSVFSLAMLVQAIRHIRNGRIRSHQISMISIYFLALIGAGIGALMPGRLLGSFLFGW